MEGDAADEEDAKSAKTSTATNPGSKDPLSDDEDGGLDEAALAKFASDDEDENDGTAAATAATTATATATARPASSWDAVLADVRGEKSEAPRRLESGPAGRARGGTGGWSVFRHDAARARTRGGNKAPRGTVSFMPKEGRGRDGKGAQRREWRNRRKRRREVDQDCESARRTERTERTRTNNERYPSLSRTHLSSLMTRA